MVFSKFIEIIKSSQFYTLARNDLRISKSQRPALPEQRDLFEGLAEIKLEIRPLRPAEMGSAKVIGLAVAAFRSSRFIACPPLMFRSHVTGKRPGMRVLLIEDDSTTAQSIELMLKSESFNVYTTDLGEEGIDLGKIYDYDVILLDLNFPDMSGFDVLRKLRISKVTDTNPDPLRACRHRGQDQRSRLRRRRLHDQAVPQG